MSLVESGRRWRDVLADAAVEDATAQRLIAHHERTAADQHFQAFSRKGGYGDGQCPVESPALAGRILAHIDDLMAPHSLDMG